MSNPYIASVTVDLVAQKIGYNVQGIRCEKGVEIQVQYNAAIEKQLLSWASEQTVKEIKKRQNITRIIIQ